MPASQRRQNPDYAAAPAVDHPLPHGSESRSARTPEFDWSWVAWIAALMFAVGFWAAIVGLVWNLAVG